jgi:hypothetical protein
MAVLEATFRDTEKIDKIQSFLRDHSLIGLIQFPTTLDALCYIWHQGINTEFDTGAVEADSEDDDGQTPLLYEAVVKLLLAIGRVEADGKNENGKMLLLYAATNGHKAIVKPLELYVRSRSQSISPLFSITVCWAAEMTFLNATP